MARKYKKPRKFQFLLYPPESMVQEIRAAQEELNIEDRSANQIAVEIISTFLPAWVRSEKMKRAIDFTDISDNSAATQ